MTTPVHSHSPVPVLKVGVKPPYELVCSTAFLVKRLGMQVKERTTEAYEAIGLNVFTDYKYLQGVWQYHQQMVDAICTQNYEAGYKALLEHTDLIYHRPEI